MLTTLALGAGIAHHHGIGRVRREYLGGELGETGVALLRTLKHALDPDDLLNPGVLIPSRATSRSRLERQSLEG
jgi:alkyldihydroxyacetonephosphate synthase